MNYFQKIKDFKYGFNAAASHVTVANALGVRLTRYINESEAFQAGYRAWIDWQNKVLSLEVEHAFRLQLINSFYPA